MMKGITRLIVLGLFMVLSQKSFALACLKDDTQATDAIYIGTSVAVPNTLPQDSVLWRSQNYSISVTCWQDRMYYGAESVYFYLSPLDRNQTQLGPDLEIGIGLDGRDLRCSRLSDCRIELPVSFSGCFNSGGCKSQAKTFALNFNFFLSKKSPPSTGREGPLTSQPAYAAFQLDGVAGINSSPDKNFRMMIAGTNQFRYIACSSILDIEPRTVNFGNIPIATAQTGKVISEMPFSITAVKNCSSAYGLGGLLSPVGATVTTDNALVPNDNKSVSVTLLNAQDGSVLPFGKEFSLVPYGTDQVVVKNYLARLKWNTSQPTAGKFSAAATVDIYYK
ncbi:fimbrial protein [Burkholderia cenocepacia]|uniref:fimbrial protein n=1 Tax=Burkholderia cenocepacia TaxID=95486 RepID=UPI002AB7EAF7|nr:fimbrial protein [Burkholderia cenocepacia]